MLEVQLRRIAWDIVVGKDRKVKKMWDLEKVEHQTARLQLLV